MAEHYDFLKERNADQDDQVDKELHKNEKEDPHDHNAL